MEKHRSGDWVWRLGKKLDDLEVVGGEMKFRLSTLSDLPQLKRVYRDIVQDMDDKDIRIWDDIYPCEFLEEDIRKNQLYVLTDKDEIVSAFALTKTNSGESSVEWTNESSKVYYLDRLGVNKEYSNKGIGSYMLDKAKDVSKSLGAEYLRLFVVDVNEPAIRLYLKNGFEKVDGIYEEKFDDGFILREFGYEIKL